MTRIIRTGWLPRLVLAWFVAFVGASVMAPLFHPVAQEIICSADSGPLSNTHEAGSGAVHTDSAMHCALCLPLGNTLAAVNAPVAGLLHMRHVLRAPMPAQLASIEALTPLSRGPPSLT